MFAASFSLSVAVPARNEANNIIPTIETLLSTLEACRVFEYEIIIVDDGSSDGTFDRCVELYGNNSRVHIVKHEQARGLGGAIKTALKIAQMEYFMEVHGKNDIPQVELEKIIKLGSSGVDMVIPYQQNTWERSWGRAILSKLFTSIINTMFGHKIKYYNHYVLYKSKVLKSVNLNTNSFFFQAELILKCLQNGASYTEVPVRDFFAPHRKSSALSLKNICGVANGVFRLFGQLKIINRFKL